MNYEDLAKIRREAAFGLVGTVKALVFIAKTTGMPIPPDSLDASLATFHRASEALEDFENSRPPAGPIQIAEHMAMRNRGEL